MNVSLLTQLARIESGNVEYIDGDVFELREIASTIGNYLIVPIGGGKCKVTRLRVKERPFIEILREELSSFSGEPISFNKDSQYVRTQVSIYNRTNNTQFRVRIVDSNTVHVFSDRIEDYVRITQEQFNKIESEMMERLALLRAKVSRQNDEKEEEEVHTQHEPVIIPKTNCVVCSAEFTPFSDTDIYCDDCHGSATRAKAQEEQETPETFSSAIETIRCEECTEDFVPHKEGVTKCADCAPPYEWDDEDVI